MRLCCLHDGFNGTVGLSLSHVILQGAAQDGQLPVGLEAAEGFLRLEQDKAMLGMLASLEHFLS